MLLLGGLNDYITLNLAAIFHILIVGGFIKLFITFDAWYDIIAAFIAATSSNVGLYFTFNFRLFFTKIDAAARITGKSR